MNFRSVIINFLFTTSFFAVLFSSAVCGEEKEQKGADEIWLSGRVIWSGHDLTRASVEVFRDPHFKDLYTSGLLLDPEGIYALAIDDPGTYYIVAFLDDNGDGRFGTGDGMGIYGIKDWADPDQKPKSLRMEKGMKLTDIDIEITAVVDDQGRMRSISLSESGEVSGISGKIIWPNAPTIPGKNIFSSVILLVYSDPSWNNRIAQAGVKETGEYEVSVSAGRYYLLAVIDENKTNLLDAGDKFGIWGTTRFGMFPKAVRVDEGYITKNRNILIIGQIDASGKPLPLQVSAKNTVVPLPGNNVTISGNVLWPGHVPAYAGISMVQAYTDPSMTVPVAQARTDDKGKFRLLVPAGDYYIVASADADGDGKYTAGDGMGAYGVENAAEQMPKKLTATEDSKNDEINLMITAQFDISGQLKHVSPRFNRGYSMLDTGYWMKNNPLDPPLLRGNNPESSIQYQVSSIQHTGISGKIVWEGIKFSKAALIFSDEPGFESGVRVPLQLDDDGSYNCSVPPGDYYIMAIMDSDGNDQTDSGMSSPPLEKSTIPPPLEKSIISPPLEKGAGGIYGIGFYGAGHLSEPQRVTVIDGKITLYINIYAAASLGPDGKTTPIQTPWSVYSSPEEISGTSRTERADPSGVIYYTFDGNIWVMDADGTDRRWVASGICPTASSDGSKLLFLDTSGNIYLIEPGNDVSTRLVLSRRKAGLQPVISRAGKATAFAQEMGGYRRLILKNLETNEESPIPTGDMDLYNPSWSPDDELIAYSASIPPLPIQPRSPPFPKGGRGDSRDIYYYDLVTGRTERVSTSLQDEFAPAWSPVDKYSLVYCRAEEKHAQLWIATLDANGKTAERQLTKYGGQNPAWSPGGDKIIYENNAQLWTIKPDGTEEVPVVVDGEPIFGSMPFWTR